VTNAATTGARLSTGSSPPPARAAAPAWLRMAVLGLVLLALGVLGLVGGGAGDRVLLAGVGLVAAVRGTGLLRGARAAQQPRQQASTGALAVWLGLVAVAVALLSGTATGWVLTALVVLALPALAVAGQRSAAVAAVAATAVVAGAVLLAVLGGTGTLLAVGTAAAAAAVAVLGLANLIGAVGMWRIARRPAPAPAAGCGGCACGAGGCGSPA
jgi:hypothetical protein